MIYNADYLTTTFPQPAQLIVTSPEYPGLRGNGLTVPDWLDGFGRIANKLYDDLDDDGVAVVNVDFPRRRVVIGGETVTLFDTRIYEVAAQLQRAGFAIIDETHWDKINPPPNGNVRNPRYDRSGYERIWVAAKSADYYYRPNRQPYAAKTTGRSGRGVNGSYAGGHTRLHSDGALPTNVLRVSSSADGKRPRAAGGSFPRKLAQHFILSYSRPGAIVLDPFAGVATTGVVALENGRRFYGTELDTATYADAVAWLATAGAVAVA